MYKSIDVCTDDVSDISNWMQVHSDRCYTALTDQGIIASYPFKKTGCTDKIGTDHKNSTTISHTEAATQLDQLMVYCEQLTDTTPNDLLVDRDRVTYKRNSKLQQQKITTFYNSD